MKTVINTISSLFVLVILTGCVSPPFGRTSFEEASQLAIESKNIPPEEPNRSLVEFKEVFTETIEPWACEAYESGRESQELDIFKTLKSKEYKANKGAAALASWLAGIDVKRGQLNTANDLPIAAFNLLPGSVESTRKMVLAFNIGRIYAYQGDRSSAQRWFSLANKYFLKTGDKDFGHVRVANGATANASLAYLDGNVLAEEYFLKQSLPSVWYGRTDMKVGVNAEYIFSKLVDNLISQGRYLEAEYFARTYLYRLKKYSTSKLYYPLLMHRLSLALQAQNKLDDALWAVRISLLGHKNTCAIKDGAPQIEARITAIKILSALGDKQGLVELKNSIEADFVDDMDSFEEIFASNF